MNRFTPLDAAGIAVIVVVLLFAAQVFLGCATTPEPEIIEWRRCAQECPDIFFLDFGTEPPTRTCMEVAW